MIEDKVVSNGKPETEDADSRKPMADSRRLSLFINGYNTYEIQTIISR